MDEQYVCVRVDIVVFIYRGKIKAACVRIALHKNYTCTDTLESCTPRNIPLYRGKYITWGYVGVKYKNHSSYRIKKCSPDVGCVLRETMSLILLLAA